MESEQESHWLLEVAMAQLSRNRPIHRRRRHSSPPASTGPGYFPMCSAWLAGTEDQTTAGCLLVRHCWCFPRSQTDSASRYVVAALAAEALAAAFESETEWSAAAAADDFVVVVELVQALTCQKDY